MNELYVRFHSYWEGIERNLPSEYKNYSEILFAATPIILWVFGLLLNLLSSTLLFIFAIIASLTLWFFYAKERHHNPYYGSSVLKETWGEIFKDTFLYVLGLIVVLFVLHFVKLLGLAFLLLLIANIGIIVVATWIEYRAQN